MNKDELKLYQEWEQNISEERDLIVYDSDGYRMVCSKGNEKVPMTKSEAERYFIYNTVMSKPRTVNEVD